MYLCIFTKNNGTKALSYTKLIFKMSVESLRRSSHVDTHCACCLHWLGESTISRIRCESTTKSFVKFSQRLRSQETEVLHYVFQWFVLDTFKLGILFSFVSSADFISCYFYRSSSKSTKNHLKQQILVFKQLPIFNILQYPLFLM